VANAEPLREEMIRFVLERASHNGDSLGRSDLRFPLPEGGTLPLIDPMRGIRNPLSMDATITVLSSINGPYEDGQIDGGFFRYAYRKGSAGGDNTKLRRALELELPIILLRKTSDSRFIPHAPVYVVEDLLTEHAFLLALDESIRFLTRRTMSEPQRRYAERITRQRLHQKDFRGSVIAAYSTRCAICRLNHGELLDAAHITADSDELGVPVVTNGLSLCKIHHAAYDQNMLGISPDYVVKIDHGLLNEVDGPMLRHGLQDMHGAPLTLPKRKVDHPDRDRLADRFARFMDRAS
jgi:putative restriction endonuclease